MKVVVLDVFSTLSFESQRGWSFRFESRQQLIEGEKSRARKKRGKEKLTVEGYRMILGKTVSESFSLIPPIDPIDLFSTLTFLFCQGDHSALAQSSGCMCCCLQLRCVVDDLFTLSCGHDD